MPSAETKSAIAGAVVGAIASGVITYAINTLNPQPATFIIDGERVVITETDYESLVEENERLQSELDEREAKKSATDLIRAASEKWDSGDRAGALRVLKTAGGSSSDVTSLYRTYSQQYIDILISESDELVASRRYEDACKTLSSGIDLVVDPSALQERLDLLRGMNPTSLNDLKIADSKWVNANLDGRATDTVGNTYQPEGTLLIWSESEDGYGFAKYYLGGSYAALTGQVSVSDETNMSNSVTLAGKLQVFVELQDGDLTMLYETPSLTRSTAPFALPEMDVSDAQWLEIRFYTETIDWYSGVTAILSDVMLYKS